MSIFCDKSARQFSHFLVLKGLNEEHTRKKSEETVLLEIARAIAGKRVIIWYHDECVFYAHDRKQMNWYKQGSSKLHQKGEGQSLMVSDFVSVDFGWSLTSLDGTRTARRFLKPGKGREGYLTCEDVVQQASDFMDILDEVHPEFEHGNFDFLEFAGCCINGFTTNGIAVINHDSEIGFQ